MPELDIRQFNPDDSVAELTDEELMMAHMTLHALYREFQQHEDIKEQRDLEDWSLSSVVQKHEDVALEIEARDLPHDRVSALDDQSPEAAETEEEMEATQSATPEAKSWAERFVAAEQKLEFVQESPPKADWLFDAIDFVQTEDSTVSVDEYVNLSQTSYEEADEWVRDWMGETLQDSKEEFGVVAYHFNDETENGAFFLKNENQFQVFINDNPVYVTEQQQLAYDRFVDLAEGVDQGLEPTDLATFTFDPNSELEQDDDEVGGDQDEDLIQGEIIGNINDDYIWYVWDEDEATQWATNNGFSTENQVREGNFISFIQEEGSEFEALINEWRGPPFPPRTFVEGLDDRPYLLTLGFEDEPDDESFEADQVAQVQAVKFQVERPPEAPEEINEDVAAQADIREADRDWYWYLWDRTEVETWLQTNDFGNATGTRDGNFVRVEIQDADEFDRTETTWQGRRVAPTDPQLAGGEKPRRVTFGINDDESEQEIVAIEFLVSEPTSQLARRFVDKMGYSRGFMEQTLGED